MHNTSAATYLAVILILVGLRLILPPVEAICKADDYCPYGWNVKRKANLDPTTCDPTAAVKCEKPYQCVHSHCGMSFCCVQEKRFKQWLEAKEIAEEMENDSDDSDERKSDTQEL
ncbi:unnamed protein product [Nippostrongylus brasiliensis]|uniref:WAP domain-containing protein n=1 Tax=Nippostrongylus brasiliensis TaxID=27835 RepID=A0A0N4Y9M3_NIPBR|nr:hypothetical protein Q1695_003118 [Nippostrongylus brasiliensis]VDL76614.1 unnamed protein product [Nippostrongylus brasiliensis]